jgi:hypothetical protein
MPPANWNTLVDNIKARVCIPFLGAGAAAGVLPTGAELAAELQGVADPRLPFPFPGAEKNLAKVAQVAAALDGDAQYLKRKVAAVIVGRLNPKSQPRIRPPALHAALARLRLPVYLTTNYDKLLEDALEEARVPHVSEICRWNGTLLEEETSIFDSEGAEDPLASRSLVFHLHGMVDKPESLVVTEDDYLDFLLNVAKDVAGKPEARGSKALLPYRIRKLIKNKPLVFIGYSLSDVNFLVILRGLVRTVEPSGRVQRVAVYLDPKDLPPGADLELVKERIETYFHWTLALEVFWGDADQFTQRLQDAFAVAGADLGG